MIILIGKSGTGKSTIAKMLRDRGYNIIVTTTTRPQRDGEENGVDYYFVDNKSFTNYLEGGLFAEHREYHTAHGIWYYGSLKADYIYSDLTDVIILTPDGVKNAKELIEKNKDKILTILIESPIEDRRKGLNARGDDVSEVIRRIEADKRDFDGAEDVADIVSENKYDSSLEEIVSNIDSIVKDKIENNNKAFYGEDEGAHGEF